MPRKIINPPQLPAPRGFNHAFLCHGGQVLFLAGQDASDSDGQIVAPGDLVRQFEQVLRNLQTVVTMAGGAMTDIVKLNVFIRDRDAYMANLPELGRIHRRFFGHHYPAMALFEVTCFFRADNLIEMEGFAYLDGPT